jgi:DNA polymerase III subunit gamma/tau
VTQTLALARKYRPRSFGELVGQEHVVRALSNALSQARLHHAYLFTGTRGVGKTTLARILAKALNCETGVSAQPCGQCGACKEIDSGRFVDLLELDAASNTQVDQMRELLDNALYAPTKGRFKVYIIDEVHMLSRNAFNAMLKTLEEPPEHVKFILATTDPQKVPVTVLSRCLQFGLKQIPQGEIRRQMAHVLERENIAFDGAALALLARGAQGSLRDGLSLLDQAIVHGAGKVEEQSVREMLGSVDRGRLLALLDALAAGDGKTLIAIADELLALGASFDSVLEEMASLLHRLALAQSIPEALAEDEPELEALRRLAQAISPEELQLYYQIALHGRDDLGLAPDHHAGFTMTVLRMLTFKTQAGAPPAKPAGAVERPVQPAAVPKSAKVAGESPKAADASVAMIEDWPALLASLKLGGMAAMLAQHCELAEQSARGLTLRLPEAHKHLLDKAYRDKLQTALETQLGRKLQLQILVGDTSGRSPSELQETDRRAKQAKAIAAIESDPFVRELVENFDGRIVSDSIKPLQ